MCHNNPLHIWRTKKQRCTLVWVNISFFGVKKHQRPTIIQFFGQKFLCFSPRRSGWESVVTCLSTTTFWMVLCKIVRGKKTLVDTPNPMKFQAYAKNKLGMDGLISQRLLLKLGNSPRKWWYGIKFIYLFIVALVDVNNYNTWIDLRESRLKYINYYASNVMLNENNIHVVRNIVFFWD